MNNICAHILLAFVLQSSSLVVAHAGSYGDPRIDVEVSKQETIYRSRGEQIPDGYIVDRSLLSYAHTLAAEFDRSLAGLGPADRWLDIGAGEGKAILDYYTGRYDRMHYDGQERPDQKAQAVAISIEDRRTPSWQLKSASLKPHQIQYLFSRRLREYSQSELGQFQLITDVVGGFSYTVNLSQFVQKVLRILALNGNFYTLLVDVRSEAGTNKPYYADSFLTEIANVDGREMTVCSWLKKISCVEVTCEFKSKWQPPVETYTIHKACDGVTVPNLMPTHYQAGTPPERTFQVGN